MKSRFEKLKKLCGKNLDRALAARKILHTFTVIAAIALMMGDFILAMYLITVFGAGFIVLAIAGPFLALGMIKPSHRALLRLKDEIATLREISVKVDVTPILFFDDVCLQSFIRGQEAEVLQALIDGGNIKRSQIVGGLLIAKTSLGLTEKQAEEYVKNHAGKIGEGKKIVIKLADELPDTACDNCGVPFSANETFCGNCGTMRKDLRRRI